jgi:hypothetical protein
MQVRRPGYTSGEEQGGGHRLTVEGDISGMVLYLTPTATITGHVLIPDGADTTGMSFIAYRRRTRNGHTQWQQAGLANTNADGVFKMYDMQSPGDYVLCNPMFVDRASPRQGKAARGLPCQCYPADPGDGRENLLHLSPGQQPEVEITRTMQPFYPVKIVVANEPAGERGGFQVFSQNGVATGAMMQWKEEGWTEVDLPNGSYYAERRDWGKGATYGRVDFKVENGAPAPLTLVLLPLAPVAVQFHKDFTARPEEQRRFQETRVVTTNNDTPPAQLELMPADGINDGGGSRSIRHAEGIPGDGFVMEGVTPGRYWVQAPWSMEGYVSAITSGGVDLSREPLTIGPGNTVPPIEVTLRNDTGQIDFTVNGAAMGSAGGPGSLSLWPGHLSGAGFTVYAIPAGARFSRQASAVSIAAGAMSLLDIPPGTYYVMALEKFLDLDALDDQQLARVEEHAKRVTVPAGGAVSVQLDLMKGDDEEPVP